VILDLRRRQALAQARRERASTEAEESLPIQAWADLHLRVPRGSGMTPHDSAVTPYWRHWLGLVRARVASEPNATADHLVETIDLVTGTQVGKTQGFILVILAWIAALFPRDVATVLPSEATRKAFSRNRVKRAFEQSPRLAHLLPRGGAEAASRMGISAWVLAQSLMFWKNGAVALELRGDDVPLVLTDEFDALPADVDGEGDPFRLIGDRQKSYPHEKLMANTSTCTVVSGHAWRRLCEGSHERLHIRCDGCGAHHWIDPDHLKPTGPGLSSDRVATEDAARWHCPTCDHAHTSDDRDRLVAAACAAPGWTDAGGWVPGVWEQDEDGRGHWTAAAHRDEAGRITAIVPATGRRRSGHLPSTYARSITFGAFLAAQMDADAGSSEDRQAFINGWRAEPYEVRLHSVAAADLTAAIATAEAAPGYVFGQCPAPAYRVALACDQQGIEADKAWFPYTVRAWQEDGTSFLVDAGRADGWAALDALAQRTWPIGGAARRADAIAIDSANGQMIRPIRAWCAKDPRRRLSISFSGTMGPDAAWTEIPLTPKNAHKLCGLPLVWYGNQHLYADELYDLIRGLAGKPAWRIPPDAPDWYRASLTSEHRTVVDALVKNRRISRSVWQRKEFTDPQGRRFTRNDNHWLDTERLHLLLVAICRWLAPRPQDLRSPTRVGDGDRTRRLTERRSLIHR
jgi:phage terminase large subunit GpA-like protein